MVRFTLAALALSALSSYAAAAAAPDLGSSVSDSQCDQYTNGEGAGTELCGPLTELSTVLLFQGNSVTTNADEIINTLQSALGGDSNAVSQITGAATNGLVSNLAYGVSALLGGTASTVNNAAPQCKCDLSFCLSNLRDAAQASSVPTDTAQASCAQAKFACNAYYSNDQLYKVAPGCANFEGTTGQSDDSSSSSSSSSKRRSIRFARE